MRFSELMKRVQGRGVVVKPRVAMPASAVEGVDPEIRGVGEDSRRVKAGDLFVARGGTRTDGGKFIVDALNRGAVAVVGEMVVDIEGVASAQVEDANLAGALLAHEVAGNPTSGMKMIGVTGTKGKTTVAYLLRSVLKAAGYKVGMIGTVEIDDGEKAEPAEMTTPGVGELVEMFGRMKANGVTHCVMEVSSHALHQKRVAGIDFAVGIFTNLTGDHLDYHKTMEEYAAAKAILFEGLGEGAVAVVNGDDTWAERMVKGMRARVMVYGMSGQGKKGLERKWTGAIEEMSSNRMELTVGCDEGVEHLETPLVGRHNAYNLLSVIVAGRALGINVARSCAALREARGAPGRLQRVEVSGCDFSVFVDYAHTHDALENVLTALTGTMGGGRLICIFGCGGDRDRTKRPKMGAVAEKLADRVIVTSDNPRTEDPVGILVEICKGFSEGWEKSGRILVEPDRRVAIRKAIGEAREGDVVLIAGKGHENYQIIGTVKHHFDDVEEAESALAERKHEGTKSTR